MGNSMLYCPQVLSQLIRSSQMPDDQVGAVQQGNEDEDHLQYLKSRRPPQRSRRSRVVVSEQEAIETNMWINEQLMKAGIDPQKIEEVLARRSGRRVQKVS